TVVSTQIIPFADIDIENSLSSFFVLSDFKKCFATDGAAYFITRDKDTTSGATAALISHVFPLHVGNPAAGLRTSSVTALTDLGEQIQAVQRNGASGSWLLAGDFGLRVNE